MHKHLLLPLLQRCLQTKLLLFHKPSLRPSQPVLHQAKCVQHKLQLKQSAQLLGQQPPRPLPQLTVPAPVQARATPVLLPWLAPHQPALESRCVYTNAHVVHLKL